MIEHVDAMPTSRPGREPDGRHGRGSLLYARRLEELGMEVEVLDEVFPATAIVIVPARRPARPECRPDVDTVPIPHGRALEDGGAVYGRGSADMKGALACAAETARVLKQGRRVQLVIVEFGHGPRRARRMTRPGSCASTASAPTSPSS